MSITNGVVTTNAVTYAITGLNARPSTYPIARSPVNGVVWAIISNNPTTATAGGPLIGTLYRSEDNGATWTSVQQLNHPSGTPVATPADIVMQIDIDGYLHILYRGGPDKDGIYYRRGTIQGSAGSYSWSFSSPYTVFNRAGADYQSDTNFNLVVHKTSAGWAVHVAAFVVYQYVSTLNEKRSYPAYNRINITTAGSISLSYGTSMYALDSEYSPPLFDSTSFGSVAIDFNHAGDGLTASGNPELYMVWHFYDASVTQWRTRFKKLTYSSGSTWTIGSTVTARTAGDGTVHYGAHRGYYVNGSFYVVTATGGAYVQETSLEKFSTAGTLLSSKVVSSTTYYGVLPAEDSTHDAYGNLYGLGAYTSITVGRYLPEEDRGWTCNSKTMDSGRAMETYAGACNLRPAGDWMHVLYADYDTAAGTSSAKTIRSFSFQMKQDAPTTAPTLTKPFQGERFDVRTAQNFEWDNTAEGAANQYQIALQVNKSSPSTVIYNSLIPYASSKEFAAATFEDETYYKTWIKYFDGDQNGPPSYAELELSSWYKSAPLVSSSSTPTIPAEYANVLYSKTFDEAGQYFLPEVTFENVDYQKTISIYGQSTTVAPTNVPAHGSLGRYILRMDSEALAGGKTRQSVTFLHWLRSGVQYELSFMVYIPNTNVGQARQIVFDTSAGVHVAQGPDITKGSWQEVTLAFTPSATRQYNLGLATINAAAGEYYYMDRFILRKAAPELPVPGSYEYKVSAADRIGFSPFSDETGIFTAGSSTNVYVFDGSLWVPKTRKVFDGTLWKDHLVQKL